VHGLKKSTLKPHKKSKPFIGTLRKLHYINSYQNGIKISELIICFLIGFIIAFLSSGASSAKTIKAGVSEVTPVPIVAEWPINSHTQVGEHFSARVVEDMISDDGQVFIPRNSRVVGRVTDVQNAKTFHRHAQVDIKFEKIVLPDNIQTLIINADGTLIKDKLENIKLAGEALKQASIGTIIGALTGFKFGGIIGTGSSNATNLMIGAAVGGTVSLVTFISKRGDDVEIYPGLPMILNIVASEKQKYKEQELPESNTNEVQANILKCKDNKVAVRIINQRDYPIALTNLKIVDGLGYTVHPTQSFNYHDNKVIPANSNITYEFVFPALQGKKARRWIVLTDSFNKQEYFKLELH
jgi:hypothetical protein